jgi:hypothetical protein
VPGSSCSLAPNLWEEGTMANLACYPVQDLTTHSATISGSGDQIPATSFLRMAYGVTSGGPYNTFGTPVPGDGSFGQMISDNITNLLPDQTYFYVTQEVANDGITVLGESDQCQFKTLNYNTTCELLAFTETSITVRVCADYVAPEQTLDFIWGTTPGGPYPNVGGSVPGNDTLNQCAVFELALDPCEVIYYRGSVTNVPAIYEVDWAYAHRSRSGAPEGMELRLGPEADYPANQTLVDSDVAVAADGWKHKSGTYPVPLNVNTLHMGFVSTISPGGLSVGNFLDSCSIVLRRVLPSPLVIGEQLQNPGFENPPIAPGNLAFVPEGPAPPMVWQTTDPVPVIEQWGTGFLGVPSDTGGAFAELNAFNPAELFQVVPLAVATADSTECVGSTFNLDTAFTPATDIECTSAVLHAEYCGLPEHYSFQFQYSTNLSGPWNNVGPVVFVPPPAPSNVTTQIAATASPLDPNTTYFYRIVALDPDQNVLGTSETSSFTTLDCVSWCGGWFDPDTCLPVDFDSDGNTDYLNCNQV